MSRMRSRNRDALLTTNNRYSQHARRAITFARTLAKEQAHAYVDSTHLLLGILTEEGSVGCNILVDLQMDMRHTERVFRQLPHENASNSGNPGMTPALRD